MNKVQQEKITTCEERNRRRIQNDNTATCKNATWNSAKHKKSATRKEVLYEKITPQKVQHGNGAV